MNAYHEYEGVVRLKAVVNKFSWKILNIHEVENLNTTQYVYKLFYIKFELNINDEEKIIF